MHCPCDMLKDKCKKKSAMFFLPVQSGKYLALFHIVVSSVDTLGLEAEIEGCMLFHSPHMLIILCMRWIRPYGTFKRW